MPVHTGGYVGESDWRLWGKYALRWEENRGKTLGDREPSQTTAGTKHQYAFVSASVGMQAAETMRWKRFAGSDEPDYSRTQLYFACNRTCTCSWPHAHKHTTGKCARKFKNCTRGKQGGTKVVLQCYLSQRPQGDDDTRSLCVCDVVSVLACWRWHMICKNSFVHRVSTNSDAIQIRLHQYVAHMNEEMRSKADLKDVKLLASHSGLYVMHFSHSLYILIFFDWRNRQTHCRFTHHSWTTFCHLGWPAQGFQHFLPVCIQPYDYTWNRQKIVCTHHLYIQENTTHKIMHTKTHKDTHTFVHKHVIPFNN